MWKFKWKILKQWLKDPAMFDLYWLISVRTVIQLLSCSCTRDSHTKKRGLSITMNRNKYWFLFHFAIHTIEFSPPIHDTAVTVSSTTIFPKLIFVIGSRVEVSSLKLFTSQSWKDLFWISLWHQQKVIEMGV